MAKKSYQDNDKKWRIIKEKIKDLEKAYTSVGVHKDKTKEDGGPMAVIAASNEFGVEIQVTDKMRNYLHAVGLHLKAETKKVVIPERSFMRSWVDENKKQIQTTAETLIGKIYDSKVSVKQALGLLGEYATTGIKKKIGSNIQPADHPFTVKQKGSSRTLINTGQLRNSITHVEYFGRKPT